MIVSWIQIALGLILAVAISALSFRVRVLSKSGALAASLLGLIVFGFGGLSWAILLLGFFISSSGLSRLLKNRKQDLSEKFSKSSTRDAMQVFANGGISGIFVLFHLFFPQAIWPWLAFAGALAAANADTWATELGVLSKQKPVSLVTGKPVERGTSGGITSFGTVASGSGALLIAVLAVLFWPIALPLPDGSAIPLVAITLAGLLGSLVDSFLGATVQAIYYCPQCKKETERTPVHTCGSATDQIRGLTWLDNDWVNTICTLVGGLAMLFASLL